MPKKLGRRSGLDQYDRPFQTLRRSPRFLPSDTIEGKCPSHNHSNGKGTADLANPLKACCKVASSISISVGSPQPPLRRSARFLSHEKLMSVETHPRSLPILSKFEEKTQHKQETCLESPSQKLRRSMRLSSLRLTTTTSNDAITKEEKINRTVNANIKDLALEKRHGNGFLSPRATEYHQDKLRKVEGNEMEYAKIKNEDYQVTTAWTEEQEEALQKAYLMAKPTPHIWKKISRMVPGKSAQDCFEKIHGNIATPPSSQPRSKTLRKSLSPICNFDVSGFNSQVSELEAGRLRRCKTKKFAAQKIVRHLLRRHSLIDQVKPIDCFSLLDSSPISISLNEVDIHSPDTLPTTNSPFPQQHGDKLLSNSKVLSRFKRLVQPNEPSPEVLKRIKNRALHDRYIDQLHQREARRAMLAKKSNSCAGKFEYGGLKVAKAALISDAISFAKHFRDSQANIIFKLEADEDGDSNDEEIDVSE